MFFSVSHSGKLAAIAVDSERVGLDAEKLPERDFVKIANRYFLPNELSSVTGAREFARIWTRKEAYLKLTGEGLSGDLRAVDTMSTELSGRLVTFDPEGYALSVCSDRDIGKDDVDISELELKDIIK